MRNFFVMLVVFLTFLKSRNPRWPPCRNHDIIPNAFITSYYGTEIHLPYMSNLNLIPSESSSEGGGGGGVLPSTPLGGEDEEKKNSI